MALALAIAPTTGEVYVAGDTTSTNFPGTSGGAQSASGGGGPFLGDAFVARLNASLTALDQATYLGGSNGEFALALAIAPTTGEVYVAGQTSSANFPGTGGGAQSAFGGLTDAVVARLSADLTGVPCTSARCIIDAGLTSPACTGQTVPASVTNKFNRATSLIDQAGSSPAKKALKLRRQAKKALRRAKAKATRAAKGKHPKISSDCAAALRHAADGVVAVLGV